MFHSRNVRQSPGNVNSMLLSLPEAATGASVTRCSLFCYSAVNAGVRHGLTLEWDRHHHHCHAEACSVPGSPCQVGGSSFLFFWQRSPLLPPQLSLVFCSHLITELLKVHAGYKANLAVDSALHISFYKCLLLLTSRNGCWWHCMGLLPFQHRLRSLSDTGVSEYRAVCCDVSSARVE